MSKQRITVLLDAQVNRELKALVPLGKRSQMINDLLRKELMLMNRRKLTEELLAIRKKTKLISDEKLLELLREDRRCH